MRGGAILKPNICKSNIFFHLKKEIKLFLIFEIDFTLTHSYPYQPKLLLVK